MNHYQHGICLSHPAIDLVSVVRPASSLLFKGQTLQQHKTEHSKKTGNLIIQLKTGQLITTHGKWKWELESMSEIFDLLFSLINRGYTREIKK